VAGSTTEYSGSFALYFLADYINIFVISSVAVTLFWGGCCGPSRTSRGLLSAQLRFSAGALAGSGVACLSAVAGG